jgi:hypothetical protein
MQQPQAYRTASGPVLGIEASLRDIREWRPTVTQIREPILTFMVVGTSMFAADMPPLARAFAPTQDDVEGIAELTEVAVRAGRLIDFGAWTNDVIKYGGNRGGPLYSRDVIGHPFRDPYVFFHTWEDASAAYLVNPLEPERTGGDVECIELQPIEIKGNRALMIGDRAVLTPDASNFAGWSKYHCRSMPSLWRYLPGAEAINTGGKPENAAAGNVLDPLMTALLILSTRGIARETVAAPDKLQKARRKNGKPLIPPYQRVDSAPYVTAIQNRAARGRAPSQGGTHASPVMHLRMGHVRTYASGVQTFVRDAIVNASEATRAAFTIGRSHYTVKQKV